MIQFLPNFSFEIFIFLICVLNSREIGDLNAAPCANSWILLILNGQKPNVFSLHGQAGKTWALFLAVVLLRTRFNALLFLSLQLMKRTH